MNVIRYLKTWSDGRQTCPRVDLVDLGKLAFDASVILRWLELRNHEHTGQRDAEAQAIAERLADLAAEIRNLRTRRKRAVRPLTERQRHWFQ